MRRLVLFAALFATATALGGESKSKSKAPEAATPATPAATPAANPAAGTTPTPDAIAAYREAEMMAIAKTFKAMSMIAKGEVLRPQGEFIGHAESLHNLSLDLVSQYPAGTAHGQAKTEASPAIWTDAAGFAAAAAAFETATAQVLAAAKVSDNEAVKAGMTAIGQSCGGCHEKFRVED